MGRSPIRIATLIAAGAMAALGVAAAPAARAHADGSQGALTVVADHLNNPRGLSPAPGGGLYLAEAGAGGSVCVKGGPSGTTCIGLTGSLDRVSAGGVTRIATGLISGSDPGGVAATGPVSVSRGLHGTFFGLFGESSHVVPPAGVIPAGLRNAALAQLGHLWLMAPFGKAANVSDVGDQDFAWTATHHNLAPNDFPDANPNAVLYSGGHIYVADAAANALVQVSWNGAAKVLAFFPVPAGSQHDAVATCVARGPDGAFYVGELLGGSFAPGHARIWRVVPGQAPTVWASGLTTVQGCGFGSDGAFYATEFQVGGLAFGPTANPAGDVVRIDRQGHRTHLGVGQLFYPSGFAAGDDAIYVSNCSIAPATGLGPKLCPTGGQVVRIGGDAGQD